jgi:hypothetical protein
MVGELRSPQALGVEWAYWLCRCEGFRVEAPEGRVGLVDGVRFRTRLDRPDVLLVRVGRLRHRLLSVSVAEIAELLPAEGRIILRGPVGPVRGGFLARRRRLVPLVGQLAAKAVHRITGPRSLRGLDGATTERWAKAAQARGVDLDQLVREAVEEKIGSWHPGDPERRRGERSLLEVIGTRADEHAAPADPGPHEPPRG